MVERRFQHGLIGSANTGSLYLPRDELLDGFRDLCDRAFAHQMAAYGGPDRILVERTPLHAQQLGLIAGVYPDAHVVHLIRDGRAVAASLMRQPWGPDTLAEAATEWVDTVTQARAQRPPLYHEVRHEDLEQDAPGQLQQLFSALGLETSPDLLSRIREVAPEPVNTTSGPDPGATSRWRGELDAGQVAEVEQVAGETLVELGYPLVGERRTAGAPAGRPDPPHPRRRMRAGRLRAAKAPSSGDDRFATAAAGDQVQLIIDRFLAALQDGDAGRVESLLGPGIEVRLHDTGRVLGAGGGLRAVATGLVESARPLGRPVRGDSYPGQPTFTVVWAHEEATGVVQRTFVVAIGPQALITRLDYYRSP
jgi:hypothetical protein